MRRYAILGPGGGTVARRFTYGGAIKFVASHHPAMFLTVERRPRLRDRFWRVWVPRCLCGCEDVRP